MTKKPIPRDRRAAIRKLLDERANKSRQNIRPTFVFTRDKAPTDVWTNGSEDINGEIVGDTPADAPEALFVLEPEDLVDLSLAEVALVWERRVELRRANSRA